MPDQAPRGEHPAHALAERDRIDYLIALGALALVDGRADDSEMTRLRALCGALELRGASEEQVVAAARLVSPQRIEALLAHLEPDPALCESLLTDAIVIAFADGELTTGEMLRIVGLAHRLHIPDVQASLIARNVEATLAPKTADGAPTNGNLAREFAAGLVDQSDQPAGAAARAIRWLHDRIHRT